MPISQCKICKKDFYAKPFFLRNGKAKFCSLSCMGISRRNGKLVKCNICKKEIYRTNKSLNHSKSKNYFCSKSCQAKWRNSEFVGSKHSNWKDGSSTYRDIMKRSNVLTICHICECKDSRVLAVHHVDKNHKNNNIENLIWLCHNCHHLVHHYKNEANILKTKLIEKIN